MWCMQVHVHVYIMRSLLATCIKVLQCAVRTLVTPLLKSGLKATSSHKFKTLLANNTLFYK